MPGLRKLIVLAAYKKGMDGEFQEAFEPRRMRQEDTAIYVAQTMVNDYDGVVVWSREADPAIGEEGPSIILFQHGNIPEFE